jgi:hypothetical protein
MGDKMKKLIFAIVTIVFVGAGQPAQAGFCIGHTDSSKASCQSLDEAFTFNWDRCSAEGECCDEGYEDLHWWMAKGCADQGGGEALLAN